MATKPAALGEAMEKDAKVSPSKAGHSLPKLPSMTPTKVAVSKTNRKSDPPAENPYVNVVTMEDIEGKPANNNKQPLPNSLPTPPSEKSSASDSSPPKPQNMDVGQAQSPIKLRIHRSPELGKLTASVTEDTPIGSGRARTKEDIKKQLLKKKGKHRQEAQSPAHSGAENKELAPAMVASPAASPAPAPSPAPSPAPASAPARPRRSSVVEDDEGVPVNYQLGDMVWSKVSGHPYWPSMISFDPYTDIFTSLRKGRARSYHVQFFGDEGERGWIAETQMIKYEGRAPFETWLGEKCKKAKGKDKKNFQVAATRRKAWETGVMSAEEAYPLPNDQRRLHYTLEYQPPADTTASDTPSTNAAEAAAASAGRGGKKRKLSMTPGSEKQQQPRKKQRRRSSRAKPDPAALANFRAFCAEKRDQVRRDHPAYTEKQMEQNLQQQWEELSEEEQAKYSSRSTPPPGEGDGTTGKRTPKPTKKRVESDDVGGRRRSRKKSAPVSSPAAEAAAAAAPVPAAVSPSAASTATSPSQQPLQAASETAVTEPAEASDTKKARSPKSQDDDTSSQASNASKDGSTTSTSSTPATSTTAAEKTAPKRKRQSTLQKEAAMAAAAAANNGSGDGKGMEIELMKLCSASGPVKKENICAICEAASGALGGELIVCDGPCCAAYHPSCLGLTVTPTGAFKCDECATGRHTCFVCKKVGSSSGEGDTTVERCSVQHCGRFYHAACASKLRLSERDQKNGSLHCPLHTCATCAAVSPTHTAKNSKGRMYRCVRCPAAYHVGDLCVAAGSVHLSGLHIVCPAHFSPLKQMSHHSRINVSWCFNCSKGGTLLCCDTCPAAYHEACLGSEQAPPPPPGDEADWHCADCRLGKRPLYGDIIWVKLGNYRWWPGEICHPKNVPQNIQEKQHQVGEFPIHFFGTHDYFWTHMGRVFLFQEGDRGSKELANAKGLVKMFQKAVQEATKAFQIYKNMKEAREKLELDKVDKKPLPYKHVKCNVPIGSVTTWRKTTGEENETPRCECPAGAEFPCGRDSECINRMMMYECSPAVCLHADRCLNQRFTKRQYPQTQIQRADGCGWGLVSLQDIKKGEFVNEYVGDLIDEAECRRRIKQAHTDNITNFYMLTMDANRVIDAGPKGNNSRFMNHSCDPNCETQKWMVNGDLRIGLFSLRDIKAGEFLTFNYNLECRGDEKTPCKCGADICSGYLGVRPKTQAAAENEKKVQKKKKKKRNVVKRTEDDCYRCGDGGELVMCDKKDCPKAYHLECLNMAKPPHGQWTCPWHFCDLCEKRARKLCIECPNSFCPEHIAGNVFLCPGDRIVCTDHDDLLATLEPEQKVPLPNEPYRGAGASVSASSSASSSSSCDSQTASDEEMGGVRKTKAKPEDLLVSAAEQVVKTDPEKVVKGESENAKEEDKKDKKPDVKSVSEASLSSPKVNGVDKKSGATTKAKGTKAETTDVKPEKAESAPKKRKAKPSKSDEAKLSKSDETKPSKQSDEAKMNGQSTPKNEKLPAKTSAKKTAEKRKSAGNAEKRKSTGKKEAGEAKKRRKSNPPAVKDASPPPPAPTTLSDLPPVIFHDDSDNDNLVIAL